MQIELHCALQLAVHALGYVLLARDLSTRSGYSRELNCWIQLLICCKDDVDYLRAEHVLRPELR